MGKLSFMRGRRAGDQYPCAVCPLTKWEQSLEKHHQRKLNAGSAPLKTRFSSPHPN